MQTALVTGITGQDGSYLAELLISKGYSVIGAVRDKDVALERLPISISSHATLVQWDMLDQNCMKEVLAEYMPSELYNFAAYSSGEGMFEEATKIGDVNGLAVTRILDSIREVDPEVRFCQASSSEIFGTPVVSPQTELTSFYPRSPYGAAKLFSHSMVDIYRRRYGLFLCSAILFNHESPRRRIQFVTKKITQTAAKIKLGLANELLLGNLDASRDWGYSKDYVYAMWLMLQQSQSGDYVVATGKTHTVRQFCQCAFEYLDLDYRDYVRVESDFYRQNEAVQLVGDATKVRRQLGWKPQVDFKEMIHMMVDEDMRSLVNKITSEKVEG